MNEPGGNDTASDLKVQAALLDAWGQTFNGDKSSSEWIETHISWVLLRGEKAYKIKKALKLDFLDFSDLAIRRFYCEEEIRLNRRTAPEIYQRVVSIGGTASAPRTDAEPALEYAVEMNRFPQENEMSRMLKAGRLQRRHIDSLATKIASFHQGLPPVIREPSHAAYGTYDFIYRELADNYNELGALFSGSGLTAENEKLDGIFARYFSVLKEKKDLIEQRHRDGFVRECHGDLHMGNIVVIDDEAVLFDCIEFAPAFRCIDVMRDLAFAFSDLHHFGRPDYAWRLLNRYLEETGDYEGTSLLHIFAASYALVRAKVAAIRSLQVADENEKQAGLEESRRYMAQAHDMLCDRKAGMLITCGLPGAGKSVFSLAVLEKIGAVRIRSDIERKRYYGLKSLQSSAGMETDIYARDASEITYDLLEKKAGMLLSAGFRVIVDAAFLRKKEREKFHRVARRHAVSCVIAMVSAHPETLLRRVTARKRLQNDPSEAGPEVLAEKQAQFEPLSAEERPFAIEISNEDGHDFDSGDTDWESLKQRIQAN